MSRVDELVEILPYTKQSLDDACKQLGFREDDLTTEELDTLFDRIFECGVCGYWYYSSDGEYDPSYGDVCCGCFDQLDEMD